jgi:hypothetical protein
MKSWNSWITYLSWFYFADEALMTNQLDKVGNITCEGALKCPGLTGTRLLASYDFETVC